MKARSFWFKNSHFLSFASVTTYPWRIYYGLVTGMWHLKPSSVNLALIRSPTEKVGMDLVVNLQTMQQKSIVISIELVKA